MKTVNPKAKMPPKPAAPTFASLGDPFKAKPAPVTIEVGDAEGASAAGWHKTSDYLVCPKEYQLRHVRGIRAPHYATPDAFAVGILLHAAKAQWFARGFAADEATLAFIRTVMQRTAEQQKLPVSLKAVQTALRYFEEYVAFWRLRPKPKPVACEYALGPAPLHPDDPPSSWRTGRLDDVSRYSEAGGNLAIGDLKTTSGTIADCVNEYTLHGQPLIYTALWRIAEQGERKHGPVNGVVLDVVQKGYKDRSKFARVFVPVTPHSVTWFLRDLHAQLQGLARVTRDSVEERRITSCTRMRGRGRFPCEFRSLCQWGKSASGEYVMADGSSLLKAGYETWK